MPLLTILGYGVAVGGGTPPPEPEAPTTPRFIPVATPEITRRKVGKADFKERFRKFGQGELGGALDDYLNRIGGVTRGLPTKHVESHFPATGDDPLQTASPSNPTGKVAEEGEADTLLRSDAVIAQGIVEAKGDILTHDGATAERLPVGDDEYRLAARASETTGLIWLPPGTLPVRTETDDYELLPGDAVLLADASGGDIAVTLPDPSTLVGKLYVLKKIDDGPSTVTISSASLIDGLTVRELTVRWESVTLVSDGTHWQIVARPGRLLADAAAWWNLDETGAADRVDATGHGNDLTAHASPGTAAGIVGSAVSLVRASSQYLDCTPTPDLRIGNFDFSFAVWGKLDTKSGGNRRIADWSLGGTSRLHFNYNQPADVWRLNIGDGATLLPSSLGSPSTGVWYHFYVEYEAASEQFTFEVMEEGGATFIDKVVYAGGPASDSDNFNLGGVNFWDGLLCQPAFFHRRLSAIDKYEHRAAVLYPGA